MTNDWKDWMDKITASADRNYESVLNEDLNTTLRIVSWGGREYVVLREELLDGKVKLVWEKP